ncbi:MAG TPA: hypothetical protein VN688_22085 [Gemmataceae bacterium]|nr:hypothetical protein [Gemmataceae bacterium]
MGLPLIPKDLAVFLRGGPRTLNAGHYETVTLVPVEELNVVTLAVTPNMAPFVGDHPHANEYGHYAVPAVNLVRGGPKRADSFPAWLFLWLPTEGRYGSYDLDHGDLMVFGPDVTWSQIAADPLPFVLASDGGGDGEVAIEFLEPWHRYPFVSVKEPD